MPKKQMTGFSVPGVGGGASWQLVPSDKDLARRVVIVLEDRRVLTQHHHREVADYCRESVDQIRAFLIQELLNTQSRDLEQCFKAMLAACRAFIGTAGPKSRYFDESQTLFQASLDSLRTAIGRQLGELREATSVEIPYDLEQIIPPRDLSWLPGMDDDPGDGPEGR